MKTYTVKITPAALDDMEAIYAYVAGALKAPNAAAALYNKIASAIEGLNIFPERTREYGGGLRRLTVNSYSVFYKVEKSDVYVVRVLYGASDIEKRLNNIMKRG